MRAGSETESGRDPLVNIVRILQTKADIAEVNRTAGAGVIVRLHSGAVIRLWTVGSQEEGSDVWGASLHLVEDHSEADATTRSDDLTVDSAVGAVDALLRLDRARLLVSLASPFA